jgi:pilus assembly protein CpaB
MTRRILGVLLAIVLAIIGTAAVFTYVNLATSQVAEGQEAVTVLIANERIPAGTSGASLRERELVEEVVMPRSSVPDTAMSEVTEEFDTLVVTADLQPSQLLLRGMFGPPTRLAGGLNIPESMVAVSVEIDMDRQVAGYVRPGSQVAIFNTYEEIDEDAADDDEQIRDNRRTRLLLPRVEVLAVGVFGEGVTTTPRNGDAEESEPTGVILTVAVDQEDAERLIHATRTGLLYLALLTDTSDVSPGPGVDIHSLFP